MLGNYRFFFAKRCYRYKVNKKLINSILSACSSQNKYEKAIADFVQTNKKGTLYDMKLKALEMKELQKITVADSIVLLNEQTETERNKKFADAKKLLEMYEAVRSSKSAANQKYYNNLKATIEQKIDEIKQWNPNYTTIYDSRQKNEVLAIVCTVQVFACASYNEYYYYRDQEFCPYTRWAKMFEQVES